MKILAISPTYNEKKNISELINRITLIPIEIAKVFGFDLGLISKIDTDSLSRKLNSYIAERPLHSGLLIGKLEEELNSLSYSTNYNLKLLKRELNFK